MTLEQAGIIIGICTGLLSLLSVVYLSGVKMAAMDVKIGTLWTRAETTWDFLMRRALSEGIEKGVLKVNSPVVVSEEAKTWMSELAAKLKDFYRKLGRYMTERDLAFEIERQFGDEILKKVCIPNGLYSGACLIIAMEVAREVLKEEKNSDEI